jgi:hypothetical protein
VPPYLIALAAVSLACTYMELDASDWLDKLNVNKAELEDIVSKLVHMYKVGVSRDVAAVVSTVHRLNGCLPIK